MADHVAFAYLIADELEAIENPLFLQYIEHDEQRRWVKVKCKKYIFKQIIDTLSI